MKRSVKSFIILLVVLLVAAVILPLTSLAGKHSQYLQSGKEIAYSMGDAVNAKAKDLTASKKTTEEKAMAIYSYIVTNFSYDWDLYNKIINKQITRYTPTPTSVLSSRKGICYDIASLYAAMCRSVGIPAKMVKGNSKVVGGYHAWNSIYDDATGRWISMDLTVDMCLQKKATSSWQKIGSGYSVTSEI